VIRLLAIPVAGTVAALIAISIFRQPREDAPDPEGRGPPVTEARPDVTPPREPPPEVPDEPPPESAAEPVSFQIELQSDGSLRDLDTQETFANVGELLDALATDEKVRHKVLLTNGADVTEAEFDQALEKLARRFDVRKLYR